MAKYKWKFTDNSSTTKAELDKKIETALTAVGMHLEGEVKEELSNAPKRIDTGLLRNSITWALSSENPQISSYTGDNPSRFDISGTTPSGSYSGTAPADPAGTLAVYIGTNVEYAEYVHEGTSRMTPNRFLKNACTRNEAQIKTFIETNLK